MRTAHKAWLALGASIAAYEAWAIPRNESLSEGFDDFIENHPVLSIGGIALVGLHLANTFEKYQLERWDIIHQAGELLTRKENYGTETPTGNM